MWNSKKQIVFIEAVPTVYSYRLARGLKLTGKYETVLVSFSKLNEGRYKMAYDKLFVFELSHKLNNLFNLIKKLKSKKGKKFFRELKKMKPYLFQITGPDLFSLMAMRVLRKNIPKIYYSNDLWGSDKRNFFFTKEYWIKGEFQKFCEKRCFKIADAALNKKSVKEYDMLNYKINMPKMSLPPLCLDEWIIPPKKKKNKEIHIVFGASPSHRTFKSEVPFIDVIKIVTSQKVHLHTYGPCLNKEEDKIFIAESKKNKYYHYHEKVNPDILNKEMSEYDYGTFFNFNDPKKTNLFPEAEKSLIGAKMINYLESGLPIILNRGYESMKEIISKYRIGIIIEFEDLKNLRRILEKQDYSKLQKNVRKFQEEFKLSKKIKEIENFYKKVIRLKKTKSSSTT